MREDIMACCFRQGCVDNEQLLYETPEAKKHARMRDKEITKLLKEYHRQDLRKLKILLLGKSAPFSRLLPQLSSALSSANVVCQLI